MFGEVKGGREKAATSYRGKLPLLTADDQMMIVRVVLSALIPAVLGIRTFPAQLLPWNPSIRQNRTITADAYRSKLH